MNSPAGDDEVSGGIVIVSALVTSGEVRLCGSPPKGLASQESGWKQEGLTRKAWWQGRCSSVSGWSTAMEKDAQFWSHETTLTSEVTSAREARNFVRRHLLDHHQPELVDDVRLVASELTGLLIAYEGQGSFTISLQGGGGEVLLFMQDGFSAGTIELEGNR